MNQNSHNAISVWKNSIIFYFKHMPQLLPVFPLLFVPIVADALQSLLVFQYKQSQNIFIIRAIGQMWKFVPRLFIIKISFFFSAFLWGFIPIYGYFKAIEHRLKWGMASNVLIFEGIPGRDVRERCHELITNYSHGIGISALCIIPTLIITLFVVAWLIAGTIHEPLYSTGFILLILFFYIVTVPISSAVNTFLYLELKEREKSILSNHST
jgi:hypothetical protein